MSGPGVVAGFGVRIGEVPDARGAVVCADAGGAAVTDEIDGDGEGRFVQGGIGIDHEGQVQFFGPFFLDRSTDQAAAVHSHEVDDLRCDGFGGANKIALVFAVFIVDDNDDFSGAQIGQGFFYSVELEWFGHVRKGDFTDTKEYCSLFLTNTF